MAAWTFFYVKYIFGNKTTALNCRIVSSLVWTLWSSSDQFLTVWISTWCLTCTCSHSLHSLHTWTLQHVSIESPMSCLQREQERGLYTEDKMNHNTRLCQVHHKDEPTASVFAKLPKHFHEPLNSLLAESAKGYKPLTSLQSAWRFLKEAWDSGMIHRALDFLDNLGREGKHNVQTSNRLQYVLNPLCPVWDMRLLHIM